MSRHYVMYLSSEARDTWLRSLDDVLTTVLPPTSLAAIDLQTLREGLEGAIERDAPAKVRAGSATKPTNREELLTTAAAVIGGARQETYGSALDSFERIGKLWSAVIGFDVSATDVARMMILMKVSRLHHHPDHADSWVDIAGYAALGAEIARAVL